ncbi:sugar O-acetyltransferase [Cellvibrio sp. ARAG 10.3]|uniref:sugar O-acetyltransferase n=1 Tax=Cellvibrio sp. ARAG 10.3 TaxID=3451358 RepID=UPI003F446B09
MIELTLINPYEPERLAARKRAKHLCQQLNNLRADQRKARQLLYAQLFAEADNPFIEPDFYCDYGSHIYLGENFYANHHCLMLDAADIRIGKRVKFGPGVHLYTTTHPIDAAQRATGQVLAAPITIGDDCWLGGNTLVMPGVTIGEKSVVGAGSVVTRSIPAGVVAMGNPCRVVRDL